MIEFQGVSKVFAGHPAVKDLTLELREGAFSVLVGTSGSGKSTTLKMINRLLEPDRGTIRFAGEDIRQQPVLTLRRRMGYAIQSIGLFPHWTVAQNIATVPQLQRWPRARIADRIDELMALLGLEATLRDRYPHQLSGGQQQRVGVARALAADPEVLLMDEPFGALDPVTREALQQEMLRIHRLLGRTIVLVTHDIDEALRLADHLVLMDGGEVVQQGAPLEMLLRPKNSFVQTFFGRSELGVRLLSLREVGDYLRPDERLGAGVAVTRPAGSAFRPLVETIAAIGQTFPPVAVLAMAVPVLGFGWLPALIALALYGILPVLQGTLAGLGSIPPGVSGVAEGMGMTGWQRLYKVELPLAAPVILAGIRTSVIVNIGTATIASTVGASTLGTPIIIGLSGFNTAYIVQGALLVALAAIIVDRAFERLTRWISRHRHAQ